MYSPIIIFVYNRADHFEQTYKALSMCKEAKESELYIFSDGAKNKKAKKMVEEVRNALHSIENSKAFKEIHIIESAENKGLAKSVITGVSKVLKSYGRAIVIEDDCVASEYLLGYMNKCLETFENDKRIGAIAGYSPAIKFPEEYKEDIFMAFRSCSWGWATWADRFENVDWELENISDFYKHPSLIRKLNSNGSDRFMRLYRQTKGNGSSWSVRFGAHLVKNNLLTVYPRYSYISNIGCDESGVHSKAEDAEKMRVDLSKAIESPKIKFVPVNKKIQKTMKKHYSGGPVSSLKRMIATMLIVLKNIIKG